MSPRFSFNSNLISSVNASQKTHFFFLFLVLGVDEGGGGGSGGDFLVCLFYR
jgi:hypothetical protein